MSSLLRPVKRAIASSLWRFGYEIRRPSYGHEDNLTEAQQRLVGHEARVVFDVGAHVGQSARGFLGRYPGAHIYCFEPFPGAYAQLENVFADEARITAVRLALGAQSGLASFHVNKVETTNSLLPLADDVGRHVDPRLYGTLQKIDVEVTTIDEYCAAHAIAFIDLMKIDVQGAELKVLRGGRRLLSEGAVKVIQLEVQFKEIYSEQGRFSDILSYLDALGYSLYGIYDMNYGRDGGLAWADVIFSISTPSRQ